MQAAALHGTPLLALKAVTDIVDGDRPAQEEFLENLVTAARALQACAPSGCLRDREHQQTRHDVARVLWSCRSGQSCLHCMFALTDTYANAVDTFGYDKCSMPVQDMVPPALEFIAGRGLDEL